jgi:hypothetical protein
VALVVVYVEIRVGRAARATVHAHAVAKCEWPLEQGTPPSGAAGVYGRGSPTCSPPGGRSSTPGRGTGTTTVARRVSTTP